MHRPRRCLLLLALSVLLMAPAAAAEPPSAVERAQAMHERALTEARRQRWQVALDLWDAAITLDPSWKYAYNAALIHEHRGQWEASWTLARRAQRLGVPPGRASDVAGIVERCAQRLLRTHALLVVDLGPEDAAVLREGRRWEPPLEVWSEATESALLVGRPGFVELARDVRHPVGQRTTKRIQLEAVAPSMVSLRVVGTPEGAAVTVGEERVGTLPDAGVELPPGRHDVGVAADGYEPFAETITLAEGRPARLRAELRRSASVAPDPPPRVDERVSAGAGPGPWVLTAAGIASVGAGIGMVVAGALQQSTASEIRPGYDRPVATGATQAADEAAWQQGRRLVGGGAATAAVGIAALVGAVTWWLVSAPDANDDGATLRMDVSPVGMQVRRSLLNHDLANAPAAVAVGGHSVSSAAARDGGRAATDCVANGGVSSWLMGNQSVASQNSTCLVTSTYRSAP